LTLICSDNALQAVLLENESPGRVRFPSKPKRVSTHPLLDLAKTQLQEYFAGRRQSFELPLDPVGTEFQKSAWRVLAKIPYGRTLSYGEQARRLGSAKKARAVGAANGRNPIFIIIPCHRVVGKDGSLTGFAGGVKLKSRLLRFEASRASHAKT
jgi:methylated-DNA-[protein]-cysteine S-methyltransferase